MMLSAQAWQRPRTAVYNPSQFRQHQEARLLGWPVTFQFFLSSRVRVSGLRRLNEGVRCRIMIERHGALEGSPVIRKSVWARCGVAGLTFPYFRFGAKVQLAVDQNSSRYMSEVIQWLRDHFVHIRVYCHKDRRLMKESGVHVSLFDCLSGAIEHSLPLVDKHGRPTGTRVQFRLRAEEIAQLQIRFPQLGLVNVPFRDPHRNKKHNVYVKYLWSLNWDVIERGRLHSRYSLIHRHSCDPCWDNLPPLRIRASLRELLASQIMVLVSHQGKFVRKSILQTRLSFEELFMRDDFCVSDAGFSSDAMHFNINLFGSTSLYGKVQLSGLPRFAQCVAVSASRSALHNEFGIVRGRSQFDWIVQPDLEFVKKRGGVWTVLDSAPGPASHGNRRAHSESHPPESRVDLRLKTALANEEESSSGILEQNSVSSADFASANSASVSSANFASANSAASSDDQDLQELHGPIQNYVTCGDDAAHLPRASLEQQLESIARWNRGSFSHLTAEMACVSARLASFAGFPHKCPSPWDIARAGMFFVPTPARPDQCVCYCCSLALFDWSVTDDPLLVHRLRRPLCEAVWLSEKAALLHERKVELNSETFNPFLPER